MEREGDLGNYLKFNFENAIAIIDRLTKENISSDGRDFVQEALEEALDCAVYLAAHLIEMMDEDDYEPTTADEYNKDLPEYQCTEDETI